MCVMLNVFLIFTNKRKINRNKNYNELIRITCCIKSFTCMLIGICIDDNHKSLNQKKKNAIKLWCWYNGDLMKNKLNSSSRSSFCLIVAGILPHTIIINSAQI